MYIIYNYGLKNRYKYKLFLNKFPKYKEGLKNQTPAETQGGLQPTGLVFELWGRQVTLELVVESVTWKHGHGLRS